MNKYKYNLNIKNINLKNYLTKKNTNIFKKSQIINIHMMSNIFKIYNGKFFFTKYISLWSLGYSFGKLIWTKKRAKYKSKLKLKLKKKLIMQKKINKIQQRSNYTHKKLYNRFKNLIITKTSLTKIKSNIKLR